MTIPRLVVAAATSSAGKTTIATGLMAALTRQGRTVAGFKVGPDFIDPGYHALATGRPGRNLDAVLTSPAAIPGLFLHGVATPRPAELAIIEGVMGLFDGRLATDGEGSTAHIARLLGAPVLLVVDAAGSSRTAAASALGLRGFDPRITIAGVVVNRVASPRHGAEIAREFDRAGLPVLGLVPRNAGVSAPSRHLGLVPAHERRESAATIDAMAEHLAAHVDLAAVGELAATAPDLHAEPWRPTEVVRPVAGAPLVGVLAGRAFTFRYAEVTELLTAAGCRVAEIDPLADAALPRDLAALYAGGGFPEVHAVELSANAALRADLAAAIADGLPTVAECAGQLYLGRHLDGHPMVGALPSTARMTPRLTLGYRTATAPRDTLVASAGETVHGHEFHRTATEPTFGSEPAWRWDDRDHGFSLIADGRPSLHSSYLHLHWAGHPALAQRFAEAAAGFATPAPSSLVEPLETRPVVETPPVVELVETLPDLDTPLIETPPLVELVETQGPPGQRSRQARPTEQSRPVRASDARRTRVRAVPDGIDLRHHGDRDLGPGLVDLAVNVLTPAPPGWLAEAIRRQTAPLGSYPDVRPAREAIAARHGVDPAMVLPTSGGAEAFTLVARALPRHHPMVVHPQFTEPEAALRAAGAAVQRWLLPVSTASGTPPLGDLPAWADALFVGNPTNPTGWLHGRNALLAAGEGRLLVVDEAFMDATDEAESLIAPEMPGRLVLRSLSKTWGLAGLRVGYVVGDPALIATLERIQPPWSVSSPAVAAMIATAAPEAVAEAAGIAAQVQARRQRFVADLAAAGFATVSSAAPFVLIDTAACGPNSIRTALAEMGFAVRRGESFPGLGPSWIRVRVPERWDDFVAALLRVRSGAAGD